MTQRSLVGDLLAWCEVQKIKERNKAHSNNSAAIAYTEKLSNLGYDVSPGMVRRACDRIRACQRISTKKRRQLFHEAIDKFIEDLCNNIEFDDEENIAPWVTEFKKVYLKGLDRRSIMDSRQFLTSLIELLQ